MEVQECPVFEVERSQTHRHTDTQREIFSKPFTVTLPKGEGQLQVQYWTSIDLQCTVYSIPLDISTCTYVYHLILVHVHVHVPLDITTCTYIYLLILVHVHTYTT